MHELLRQFAAEQLALSGEGDAVRGRHLAFFVAFAAEGEPALFSADQTAWLVRFETEHDNLGLALDWARDTADGGAALQLTAALWSFWNTRGHYQEGRRRLLEALSLPTAQAATAARAKALNAFGALLWTLGDAAEARPLLDEALAIGRAIDDPWNIGWALLHQGMIAYQQGDHTGARPLLEAGLASGRAAGAGGRRSVGWALIFLGDLAFDAGARGGRAPLLRGEHRHPARAVRPRAGGLSAAPPGAPRAPAGRLRAGGPPLWREFAAESGDP